MVLIGIQSAGILAQAIDSRRSQLRLLFAVQSVVVVVVSAS